MDGNHIICFADVEIETDFCPRTILKNLLKKIEENHRVHFLAASELEFYVLDATPLQIVKNYPEINIDKYKRNNRFSDYSILTVLDRNEIYAKKIKDNVKNCGIKLEGLFTEYGPGQHEINIKYDHILKNCDNLILLKQCIKHTVEKEGLGVFFMAKTFIDQSGSSCHVHFSCYDENNNNYFAPSFDEKVNTTIFEDVKVHKSMLNFIAGICRYSKELSLCFAHTVNYYKRFNKKYRYAPMYVNTWCCDSKLSTVRIIGANDTFRIEFRLCGADVNPYILFTALFASGMKGIEENLEAQPMDESDLHEIKKDHYSSPPDNIYEAAKLFMESSFAKEIFGHDFTEFYFNNAIKQWEDFDNHVSAFEVNRYLDLV